MSSKFRSSHTLCYSQYNADQMGIGAGHGGLKDGRAGVEKNAWGAGKGGLVTSLNVLDLQDYRRLRNGPRCLGEGACGRD